MGIAEEQRALDKTYRAALPEIVRMIQENAERVAASTSLVERYGIEAKTAFRWLQITEEELEAERKRRALALVAPLWIAILGAIVLVGFLVTGGIAWLDPITGVAFIAILSVVFGVALRLRGHRERVFQRWLRRSISDE